MSDRELRLTKPAACPECRSSDVRRIINGFPTAEAFEMIKRDEAVPGSCFIEAWRPDWQCGACRHRWFVADDPAKQEMERIVQKIMQRFETRS